MIKLEEKLYTSTEVADILGVSLRSVYRYIEENKISPEVKTATGRHRFTKQNIVDFLYPSGTKEEKEEKEEREEVKEEKQPVKKADTVKVSKAKKEEKVEEPVEEEEVKEEPKEKVEEEKVEEKAEEKTEEAPAKEVEEETPKEEQVDWLAKFREAAKKFEDESPKERAATSSISDMGSVTREERVEKPRDTKFYYRSKLGGLKDIAQNIDKSSTNSGIDYAFTMNAGLSLHSPIKPFSMLHVYVKSKDKDFFERILMLTPSEEENSQLCLLVSDDARIFNSSMKMHGLTVVSKEKLLADIRELDLEGSLVKEAESILG